MKKLLKERFQQLAGIKSLYTLKEDFYESYKDEFKDWLDENAEMLKWSRDGGTWSRREDFANAPEFDVNSGLLTFKVNWVIDHSDYMGNVESQEDQIRTVLAKTKSVFIYTEMFEEVVDKYKELFGSDANIEILSNPYNVDNWKHSENHSRFAQWEVEVEVSEKV